MKKAIALFLALVMVLALCGCGKSEAATKVEEMISGIGEITLNSKDKIEKAENTYLGLPDNDKKQVKNYIDLINAREEYDELLDSILGDWVIPLSRSSVSLLNSGDANAFGHSGTWELSENGLVIKYDDYYNFSHEYSFSIDSSDGVMKLINDDTSAVYVRDENYEEYSNKKKEEMKEKAVDLDWKKVSSEYLSNPTSAIEKYNGSIVRWTAKAYNLSSTSFDMAIETYNGYPLDPVTVSMIDNDLKKIQNFKEYTIIGELNLGDFDNISYAFLAD